MCELDFGLGFHRLLEVLLISSFPVLMSADISLSLSLIFWWKKTNLSGQLLHIIIISSVNNDVYLTLRDRAYITRDQLTDILRAQQSAIKGFIRVYFDSVSSRIDSVIAQASEVKCSVTALSERVNNLAHQDHSVSSRLCVIEEATTHLFNQTD